MRKDAIMKNLTLDQLVDHPANVRAGSEIDENVATLAASIRSLGLLQPITVQKLEAGYGVLAGRRRVAALRSLVETGDIEAGFKVPANVIAQNADHVAAISYAENVTQEPMTPFEEYEAFAAMLAEGHDGAAIAGVFGVTVKSVRDRLRFGRVHPEIRQAARERRIALDTMKAYAAHPDQDAQLRLFTAMSKGPDHEHSSWRVRKALEEADVPADSALGKLVGETYRARGGAVAEGLFPEDAMFTDRGLAETIRDEILVEAAEKERARLGLKWAEGRPVLNGDEFSSYGRVYQGPVDTSEEEDARLEAIAAEMDEASVRMEELGEPDTDEGWDEIEALDEKLSALQVEADGIQNGYRPEDAERAGVFAFFDPHSGRIRLEAGFIRPEDRDHSGAEKAEAKAKEAEEKGLSQSLIDDLAAERAEIVAAAIAEDPALAYDLVVYRGVVSLMSASPWDAASVLDLSFREAQRPHSRPEAKNAAVAARLAAARETLDLRFLDDGIDKAEQFRRFRALDPGAKAAILAFVTAAAIHPSRKTRPGALAEAVLEAAAADIRAHWRPTSANYWSRVPKAHMLGVLAGFGMAGEAEECAAMKKAALADYMESLFAAPFATLRPEQLAAIAAWTPEPFADMAVADEAPAQCDKAA